MYVQEYIFIKELSVIVNHDPTTLAKALTIMGIKNYKIIQHYSPVICIFN